LSACSPETASRPADRPLAPELAEEAAELDARVRSLERSLAQAQRQERRLQRELAASRVKAMAQADELARMAARNASLERQAHLDPLTGVLNRRGLSRRLRAEMARSLRSGTPLAAIFVDLDDFKAVNEALGHAGGDRVLMAAAARLRDATRQGDALGRVGGDEFVVLLRGVGQASLGAVSERLRAALAAAPVEVGGGAARRVTLSAAAVVLGRETGRLEEVLAQVREAQRRSKGEGKNRVTLVAPPHGSGAPVARVVPGPWPPRPGRDADGRGGGRSPAATGGRRGA